MSNEQPGPYQSDCRALGLVGPRTIGPSDYRAPGLSDPRTNGPPDYRTLGLPGVKKKLIELPVSPTNTNQAEFEKVNLLLKPIALPFFVWLFFHCESILCKTVSWCIL